MSLEKLAIIFIIIVLPIAVVLNKYIDTRSDTLNMQISYDQKLNSATFDTVKAYQSNEFEEDLSSNEQVQMEHINASANAFFNSLAHNLDMQGYSKEALQDYVPALVFTMYDGYYIYSKFTNTLTTKDYLSTEDARSIGAQPSSFQDGDILYGVTPFISYSCRYKNCPQNGDDFVISYSLDNYITIQGMINGKFVNDSGYLISGISDINESNHTLNYNGIEIGPENILQEYIGSNVTTDALYKYHKINGTKWYYDDKPDSNGNIKNKWFQIINGRKIYDSTKVFDTNYDYSAFYYYKDAADFTEKVLKDVSEGGYGLRNLKLKNAIDYDVNEDGTTKELQGGIDEKFLKYGDKETIIFDTTGIEEPSSNFNEHRLAVIRYTIEKNLSIAIKNFNHFKYENGNEVWTDFQMPELKETEWNNIMNNATVISFLQGMPIGSKIYNGCSVIPNTLNEEVVTEKSIYIANNSNNQYYMPTYKFDENVDGNLGNLQGVLNLDLEKRTLEPLEGDNDAGTNYYYPKLYFANYDSITNQSKNVNIDAEKTDNNLNYEYNGNIYKYMRENANKNVAKAYFTALGRERYSKYILSNTVSVSNRINTYKGTYTPPLLGDIDNDGKLTNKDIELLQKYINGGIELNENQIITADMNGDGIINMHDLTTLQRAIKETEEQENPEVPEVPEGTFTKGDINFDGNINQLDLDLLQKYINETITFDDYQKNAADINDDKIINMKDLVSLQRLIKQKEEEQQPPVVKGDTNKDGIVDENDLVTLQNYLNGWLDFDDYQNEAADLNEDGIINMKDVTSLQRLLKELYPEEPDEPDEPEETVLKGDVNLDGSVNMKDLTLLQRYINGYNITLDENQMKAADMNDDGSINMKDQIALQRLING